MSKLLIALGSMGMGASKRKCCPDCGGELMMDGGCVDCGYGEDMGESESDDADEKMEIQTLLDLKKQLQSAMELVDRLIVNCD
jgi:hypothetical protein